MAQTLEHTPQRLSLKFSSNSLVLDKSAGTATLNRKVLFWSGKPTEKSIGDIADVKIDAAVDRASGVEIVHVMLVMKTGDAWALAENDRTSAEATAGALKEFLSLSSVG